MLGAIGFSYLLYQFGLDQIAENIHRAGMSLLYVILVWLAIYTVNTLAWKLVLVEFGKDISFGRLFMVTVSGFSINTITPVVSVGGEPYRVKMLAQTFDVHKSLSAVVLYRMVYFFGHMLSILAGIAFGLLFVDLSTPLRIALGVVFVGIALLILWALSVHKSGLFERCMNWIRPFKMLRRASEALEKRRASLREMDAMLTDVYRHHRSRFYAAVVLEFLSRALMGVEIYIILQGVGINITIASALFVYALYSVIINIFFFIPLNLGVREGGLILGLQSLALTPLLGVYLGVVIRIRDFFWIAIGLMLVLFTSEKKTNMVK